MQTECCICRDYKDKNIPTRWYSPTNEERRKLHFEGKKVSHGYCPTCYLLQMRSDGFTESQIEKLVQKVIL